MKVITTGSSYIWELKIKCTGIGNGNRGCGAILLINQFNLYKTYSSVHIENTTYITFRCCECKIETDIWSSDSWRGYNDVGLTLQMRNKIPSKYSTTNSNG